MIQPGSTNEESQAQAMLLCAGHGTRLRPLTSQRPKPLVPVGLKPLIDWHLEALEAFGASRVVVNVSHLAEQAVNHLEHRRGIPVDILHEETPLGIGGGLLAARSFFDAEAPFLVINADIFHAIDLAVVIAEHDRRGADATLVVRKAARGAGDELTIDRDGTVSSVPGMGEWGAWTFAGIHVLTPQIFKYLHSPGSIFAGYRKLLEHGGKVCAFDCQNAMWFDIGTAESYLRANRAAIQRARHEPALSGVQLVSPVAISEAATIGSDSVVGPFTVVGDRAHVGAGSRLSNTVMWPGVSVSAGSTLERAIVYPGGVLLCDERTATRSSIGSRRSPTKGARP